MRQPSGRRYLFPAVRPRGQREENLCQSQNAQIAHASVDEPLQRTACIYSSDTCASDASHAQAQRVSGPTGSDQGPLGRSGAQKGPAFAARTSQL